MRQTSTLALLSTSDRAITLPAKRWTPPVIGQLIVRLDICMLLDTLVNTTAPSAHSYCPIHNHCWVLLHIREWHRVFIISPEKQKKKHYCAVPLWYFFLKSFYIERMKLATMYEYVCVCMCLCSNDCIMCAHLHMT